METLKHDWLTEGLMDYEYKKFILLAYLKDVQRRFNKSELYPFMSDLVFHYRNLLQVKERKQLLFEQFPKTLSHADFLKLKISYDKLVNDDEVMAVIEDILTFALPKMERTLDEGKELFEFVEAQIELSPVGVSPIYALEGYLFIHPDRASEIAIYRYQMTLFEHASEKYRSVSTTFVRNEWKNFSSSYENIKVNLAKSFKDLPNPATYLAISKLNFPVIETILPVAKRMLVREISE